MDEVDEDDLFGCEAVVHFAAFGATPQPATWQGCFQFNVVETLRLAEVAYSSGVVRFIAAGSYAEYGKSGLRYDFIPVDAPLEPTDPYAASKAAANVALSAFANRVDMNLFYGRIFSAYGEGQFEGNLWPSLKKAALSGNDFPMTAGEQIRDFIDVKAVVVWFVDALDRDLRPGSRVQFENVGTGEPQTLRQFAEYWWDYWNASGKLMFGALPAQEAEVMRYIPKV
jgi:nucleoside-diphosphate-sugar epimerase